MQLSAARKGQQYLMQRLRSLPAHSTPEAMPHSIEGILPPLTTDRTHNTAFVQPAKEHRPSSKTAVYPPAMDRTLREPGKPSIQEKPSKDRNKSKKATDLPPVLEPSLLD